MPLKLLADDDPRKRVRAEIRLNYDEEMREILGRMREAYAPARAAIKVARLAWNESSAAAARSTNNDEREVREAIAANAREAAEALEAWCSDRHEILRMVGFYDDPVGQSTYEDPAQAAAAEAERAKLRHPKESTRAFKVHVHGGLERKTRAGIAFTTEPQIVNRSDLSEAHVIELFNTPHLYVEELASESKDAVRPTTAAAKASKASKEERGAEVLEALLRMEVACVSVGAPAFLLDDEGAPLYERSPHAKAFVRSNGDPIAALTDEDSREIPRGQDAEVTRMNARTHIGAAAVLEMTAKPGDVARSVVRYVWPELAGKLWADQVGVVERLIKTLRASKRVSPKAERAMAALEEEVLGSPFVAALFGRRADDEAGGDDK